MASTDSCARCPTATDEATTIGELVAACAAGDAEARRRFQDVYGGDIYNFPVKIYRLSEERAADFYVYVFERDRIFTRLRTFEGRNNIQLRTFLAYYVLKALFIEWQRGQRELDTISLQAPISRDDSERTLEDVTPGDAPEEPAGEAEAPVTALWEGLEPEERLDLKLLSLLEHDLGPDDVRLLAKLSKRSVRDTVGAIAEVQAKLCATDRKLSKMREDLDSVWGWIVLRRRELQQLAEKIRHLPPDEDSPDRRRLEERRSDLEAAIAKRERQRERVLRELRKHKVTTPYKDIAVLLGTTVGTVCSRIFRLRQRLAREGGVPWPLEEGTA